MPSIKKFSLGLSLAALILGGASCYSSNTTSTGTGNAVSITGSSFSPANLTVAKGTTVTWTNNDSVQHTVTGDNGGPNTPNRMNPGDTYQFTFNTAGSFPYHCEVHGSSMSGTVTVTE